MLEVVVEGDLLPRLDVAEGEEPDPVHPVHLPLDEGKGQFTQRRGDGEEGKRTIWVVALGSQEWLMNLETDPLRVASMTSEALRAMK